MPFLFRCWIVLIKKIWHERVLDVAGTVLLRDFTLCLNNVAILDPNKITFETRFHNMLALSNAKFV